MKMIVPIDVDSSVLAASNILENDHAAWNSGTTYSGNGRVIVVSNHSVYQSTQDGNTNKNPLTEPNWWVRVGATNKWKAFDDVIQDQASRSGGISYELDVTSRCDGIALFNLDAESVTVTVNDPTAARINLLLDTNDFNGAAWNALGDIVWNGFTTDPDGGNSAQVYTIEGFGSIAQGFTNVVTTKTHSVFVRSDNITSVVFQGDIVTISPAWTRISFTDVDGLGDFFSLTVNIVSSGQLDVWHPQTEYSDTPSEYQEINSTGDVISFSYSETRELQDFSEVEDYWSYFFAPIGKVDSIVFEDVPAFAGTTVSIYINSDGVAKVGEIVLGQNYYIGRTHAGARVGFRDFSRVERDVFGNLLIIPRAAVDTIDLNFEFDARKIATIKRTLSARSSKPTVFHDGAEFEGYGLLAYGLIKADDFPIVTRELCVAHIEVEGLT